MTLARRDLEIMLFWLARMREAYALFGEFLGQLSDYLEHLLHGGDPNETRRHLWLTREAVKARRLEKP